MTRSATLILGLLLVLPAPCARAEFLFISSINTGQVLEYDGTTGAFDGVFVPTGSAGLDGPYELVFGPNGNLFVGDPGKGMLEFNGTTGAPIGTGVFVPAGTAGLTYPYGLAFGPNGNLFVSSRGSNYPFGQVLEFNGATGAPVGSGVFVQGGSAGLHDPLGLAFGPNGNLFVSDGGPPGQVLEYDGTTGAFVTTFVPGASGGLNGPVGLTFGPNGNLFVTNGGGNVNAGQVLEYDGTTGAFITAFVPTGLNGPAGLTFGPNGNLFITSYSAGGGQVMEYDSTTGAFVTTFVTDGSGGLNDPLGLAFGPATVSPAPSSLVLLCIGVACLVIWRWRVIQVAAWAALGFASV